MRKEFKNKMQFIPLPVCVIGTYNKDKTANAMTAAWATIYDYGQVFVSIDLGHKTADNLKANKAFSLSFATKETIKIADYVGMVSGKKQKDKVKKAKLDVIKSKNVSAPLFKQFPLTLECKVISFDEGNLIGKIISSSVDTKYLDKNNKLKPIDFVVYDMSHNCYRILGKKIMTSFTTKKI